MIPLNNVTLRVSRNADKESKECKDKSNFIHLIRLRNMDLINAFDGYLIIQINTLGFWADSRLPQEDEGGGRGGGAALAGIT